MAAAQDRPPGVCSFDGFNADPKLAQVTRASVGYSDCESPKGCLTVNVSAGDPVTIYHRDGAWTCAYIEHRSGSGPAWLKSADLHELHADPSPPLLGWVGNWVQGAGSIRITALEAAAKLHLKGGGDTEPG